MGDTRVSLTGPDGTTVELSGVVVEWNRTTDGDATRVVIDSPPREVTFSGRLTGVGATWARAVLELFETPTAWKLWRRRGPLCPTCSHRSRMWLLPTLDLYRCRWGHRHPA